MKKIITKIKNIFKKEKPLSSYERNKLEQEAKLEGALKMFGKYLNYDDDFTIKRFLEEKIENYLNTNLRNYFSLGNWGQSKLDDLLKNLLEKKLEEKFEVYYTEEIEEKIKKEIEDVRMYTICGSKSFEKFLSEYFEKNKVDIAINIKKVVDNEKFIDTLTEKIGEDIGTMIQDKLTENCKY